MFACLRKRKTGTPFSIASIFSFKTATSHQLAPEVIEELVIVGVQVVAMPVQHVMLHINVVAGDITCISWWFALHASSNAVLGDVAHVANRLCCSSSVCCCAASVCCCATSVTLQNGHTPGKQGHQGPIVSVSRRACLHDKGQNVLAVGKLWSYHQRLLFKSGRSCTNSETSAFSPKQPEGPAGRTHLVGT